MLPPILWVVLQGPTVSISRDKMAQALRSQTLNLTLFTSVLRESVGTEVCPGDNQQTWPAGIPGSWAGSQQRSYKDANHICHFVGVSTESIYSAVHGVIWMKFLIGFPAHFQSILEQWETLQSALHAWDLTSVWADLIRQSPHLTAAGRWPQVCH